MISRYIMLIAIYIYKHMQWNIIAQKWKLENGFMGLNQQFMGWSVKADKNIFNCYDYHNVTPINIYNCWYSFLQYLTISIL